MIDTGIEGQETVSFDNDVDYNNYGGTINQPDAVVARKKFVISFDTLGAINIDTKGISGSAKKRMQVFSGLTDDPFIRSERAGRNVASIVIEIPLADIVTHDDTLLIWATTSSSLVHGHFVDHAGRSLRSMFRENDQMNTKTPTDHFKKLGVAPDVIIFDTLEPAAYPNGRELTDDVVNLACTLSNECRVFNQTGEGTNGPTANDVPFLDEFPYLGLPHIPTVN